MASAKRSFAGPFPAQFNGQYVELLCPICGFNYVRLVRVKAHPAGRSRQTTTINARGVSTCPGGGVGGLGRGNTLTLTFHCEGGHEFRRSFLFHKGQTFLECTASKIAGDGRVGDTLWRD